MPNEKLLAPVPGDDPCGPDLRWGSEFIGLADAMTAAVSRDDGSVLDAEVARSDVPPFDEIVAMAVRLSAQTKDLRVLAVYAEASWRHGGLAAFADAMADFVAVLETWPGPGDGVHPRADESDGDLSERAAVLGRLLKPVPGLAATIGWGEEVNNRTRVESSATLKNVFGRWSERLDAAFAAQVPSRAEAWRSLQRIMVDSAPSGATAGEEDSAMPGGDGTPALDVWDLIDRAVEQMGWQDHQSPALPVLQLLAGWRLLDIVEIVDSMKGSGVSLEQLMESIKKQTRRTS